MRLTLAVVLLLTALAGPAAALVKPMPAGDTAPSLAESWTVSKDGLTYEFVLRKGTKFHNGDPETAEDVKFTSRAFPTQRPTRTSG